MASLTFQVPSPVNNTFSWKLKSSIPTFPSDKRNLYYPLTTKRVEPILFCPSNHSRKSRKTYAAKVAGDDKVLPEGLQPEPMPKHVAVIMDGNGRWAAQRGLPTSSGHKAGADSLEKIARLCQSWGIKVLTVFAFSTENWKRSEEEVSFLMAFGEQALKSKMGDVKRNEGVRLSVIGDLSRLPKFTQQLIVGLEKDTKGYSEFHLIIALNYSGKSDMTQACKRIIQETKDGLLEIEDITPKRIEERLQTSITEYPYPDLLIRSSGELRLSNFMMWQLAHTQLYFTDTLWPDFGELELAEAIKSFQQSRASKYEA